MDEIRTDENGIMLRPRRYDAIVRRRAAELALPELRQWNYIEDSDQDLIAGLMKHISGSDGLDIVKSMERDGWAGNALLVEIMDQDFIGDAEKELVTQWVKCLGVKLDLPMGAQVLFRGLEAKVVRRNEGLAQYGVHSADQNENTYSICNAEDVKVLREEAA